MGAPLEIIIPLAVALSAGYQNSKTCTGPRAEHPLAENMCAGMRLGLEKGCENILSLPVGATGVTVAGKYKITPVQFPELVKKKIGESYQACDLFWSGRIGFAEYETRLSEKASVLNALYASLNMPATQILKQLNDTFASAGAQAGDMGPGPDKELASECDTLNSQRNTTLKGCQDVGAKQPAPAGRIPIGEGSDLARSIERLADEFARLHADKDREPASSPRSGKNWRLLGEVAFESGSAALGTLACRRLSVQLSRLHLSDARIQVIGYADPRGTDGINRVLSFRRASAVAQCLLTSAASSGALISATGEGAIPADTAGYARTRRASVFLVE